MPPVSQPLLASKRDEYLEPAQYPLPEDSDTDKPDPPSKKGVRTQDECDQDAIDLMREIDSIDWDHISPYTQRQLEGIHKYLRNNISKQEMDRMDEQLRETHGTDNVDEIAAQFDPTEWEKEADNKAKYN